MDSQTVATLATIQQFNDAFNRHDVDAVMALMTDDCVFENTYPPPDGERSVGQAAVRGCWEQLFSASPQAIFEWEEIFACADRGVVRWRYRWDGAHGAGHVRGGKVAEKFSYVSYPGLKQHPEGTRLVPGATSQKASIRDVTRKRVPAY